MPKKVRIRSAVAGATAADRALIIAGDDPGSATAPWAPPSLPGDGVVLSRNEVIHLFFKLNDGVGNPDPATYYTIQLWWYSPISSSWHQGESFTVNADDVATVEVFGFDRLFVEVTTVSFDGGTYDVPSLKVWAGLVVPV
jgi:hypothetical protein